MKEKDRMVIFNGEKYLIIGETKYNGYRYLFVINEKNNHDVKILCCKKVLEEVTDDKLAKAVIIHMNII